MSIANSCTSCASHNLSVGMFATILEKYLVLTDWSKLDVAFCSNRNEMRKLFLDALKLVKLKINTILHRDTLAIENGAQKWITARGIRIVSWKEFYLDDNRLIKAVSANNYIASLDLNNSIEISDAGITAIAFWLNSNLKELNLSFCYKLTDLGVLAISMGAKNLESLDLSHSKKITDKSLEAISSSLPKLHKLSISGTRVSSTGLGFLVNGCLQNLQKLDISFCSSLTDDGIAAISHGNLHNLQILNIPFYICSDLTLKALANGNLSQLTELSIGFSMNVTDTGLAYLASGNLKNLKTLCISGVFSGSGIATIACGMPTLVSLSVSTNEMITNADEGLNAIFTNLVNLQVLHISKCIATDAGFAPLARSEVIRGEIKYALSSLTITSCYIADIALMSIANGLSNLKKLVIRDSFVSDIGLAALGSSGLQLESLCVSRCSYITEKGIIPVMTKLPSLKSLDISHTNIDKNIACAIAKSCGSSSVDILDISGNDITDIGLTALAFGLQNLKRLNISTKKLYDHNEVTPDAFSDEVVERIDRHFPDLLLYYLLTKRRNPFIE